MNDRFVLSAAVARALADGKGVVALETTLVTHGFPHPQGVEAAAELEAEVSAGGAVPATVGVLDGRVRVGMSTDDIVRLATSEGVAKINLSNFAARVASRRPGSTTVSASVFAAHRAGIRVLATGGIGGVHRDADETDDVSADLTALARHPVAVVCAGAKAILDLPRTLERLETLGVPVYGLGTDRFPAFYRRDGGLPVDERYDSVERLADAVRAHFDLRLGPGVVVANPIPSEYEMPLALYERALSAALADAKEAGVRGRAVTPFLLDRLRELTEGVSVFSNRALLRHNARVAASLAVALAGA